MIKQVNILLSLIRNLISETHVNFKLNFRNENLFQKHGKIISKIAKPAANEKQITQKKYDIISTKKKRVFISISN